MDDSSPLAMQFKELDTDGDSKLSVDEAHELLKLLEKNIYKGSITSAAKMLNYNDPALANFFTFPQFKEYLEVLDNPLKHDIWKGKYKILQVVKSVRDAVNGPVEEQATAAPGASAPSQKPHAQETPCNGDIEITVGPTNQTYNSFIQLSLQKTPKPESKPFIKLIFEQSNNQSAKQLEQYFKKTQSSLFDLLKSDDPQSSEILDCIHIITNVSDTKLNVFITTSNQLLIELCTLGADFIDQALGQKVEAKLQFKHQFNVDILKFLEKGSDYSFYQGLTSAYHTKLQWAAMNFKESTKEVMKTMQLFSELQYDSMDPISLLLIGILHTEFCEAKFVFDNADIVVPELESKKEILDELGDLYGQIQQEGGEMGILELIKVFNNQVYMEVSIGDWRANATIHIKHLNQLLSEKVSKNEQEADNPPQQHPHPVILQDMKQIADDSSQKQSKKSINIKKKLSKQFNQEEPDSSSSDE